MSDASKPPVEGEVRLQKANRKQLQLVPTNLDELVAPDHPARAVWELMGKLDLSKFTEDCRSRGENAGRPAIDPRILVTLRLYATSQGVGSARELARLCRDHAAYRWVCGGVEVGRPTLSDFRVGHGEAPDAMLTDLLAVMMHQDLLPLARTAQDGLKVRASAGAGSFHRQPTLERCGEEAADQVERLKAELEKAPQEAAKKAARGAAAARERLERIEQALSELSKLRETKPKDSRPDARASSTDPEARAMRMGDGGFAVKEDIESAAARGVTVYAPVQKPKNPARDPHKPRPGDTPAVALWRRRMGTKKAKEIYKRRASTAETVNADLQCFRGLHQFRVRTLAKTTCVVLWAVLA
jgi:transposase